MSMVYTLDTTATTIVVRNKIDGTPGTPTPTIP
jgi:hypothetical protein